MLFATGKNLPADVVRQYDYRSAVNDTSILIGSAATDDVTLHEESVHDTGDDNSSYQVSKI